MRLSRKIDRKTHLEHSISRDRFFFFLVREKVKTMICMSFDSNLDYYYSCLLILSYTKQWHY